MSTIEQQDGQVSSAPSDRPVWQLPAARAMPGIVVGLAVTFLQVHGALVGLVAFAALAIGTGAALLALRGCVPTVVRRFPLVAGAAGVVAGAVAGLLALVAPSGDALKVVVAAWALVAAAAEGWAWLTMRRTPDLAARRIATDWRFVAAITLAVGVAFALLPQHDVVLVGLLGAFAIVSGVFHAIAAFSARSTAPNHRETTA